MQRKCTYTNTFQVRYSKHNAVFRNRMLNNQKLLRIQEQVKDKNFLRCSLDYAISTSEYFAAIAELVGI